MKIQIPKCDVDVTEVLRIHVERRLGLALARFSDRIERVIVRFSAGDDDASGACTRCQIEVDLRPRRVDVDDTDADLFVAVNHATERATRAVSRAVEWGDVTAFRGHGQTEAVTHPHSDTKRGKR